MPEPLLLNDRLEFRCYCHDDEQSSVTSFYFQVLAGFSVTYTDLDAAIAFATLISNAFKGIIANTARFDGVSCQIKTRNPKTIPQLSDAGAGAGTAGAIGLPRQSAGLTSWRTDLAGSRGRGRSFWPFPAAAMNEGDGNPTTTYISALDATAVSLIALDELDSDSHGTANVDFVLWSKKYNTMTPITSAIHPDKWATQKRRGSFGRPNTNPFQ